MKPRTMLIGGAGIAVLLAAGLIWQRQQWLRSAVPRLAVRGGDGGGLPIAQPRDEHFDADALERASRDPAAAGLAAFIVMRHGHIIFERFGHGVDADTVIDSGPFAQVLVALLAGIAVQNGALPVTALSGFDPPRLRAAIESGTHQSYADYLSRKLWSRVNAAPAWIVLPAAGAAAPADCCFEARVLDWMRVAGLLIDDGSFEDTQVIGKGWIARMRRPVSANGRQGFGIELAPPAQGAGGFAADDAFFLRGPGHWRLWLVPSLRLAVLFGAVADESRPATTAASIAASSWDETRLPNLVIGALMDRPASQKAESLLRQLVPGH